MFLSKYRILSFDGGGVHGTLGITLLRRLARKNHSLLDHTDLLVGTSGGGVIALALASGRTPRQISQSTFFNVWPASSIFTNIHQDPPLNRPKYFTVNLRKELRKLFPGNPRLKDLKKRVLIPSFRVIGNGKKDWQPVFFHNFPGSPTANARVIDVALATTAAPIIFPSYKRHIDGMLFANNPSLAGLSFATAKQFGNQKLGEIAILSFGSGIQPYKITKTTHKFGTLQWLNPHAKIPIPLVSALLSSEEKSTTLYSRLLLGHQRFHRLNPVLKQFVSFDQYDKIPFLRHRAERFPIKSTLAFIRRNWR